MSDSFPWETGQSQVETQVQKVGKDLADGCGSVGSEINDLRRQEKRELLVLQF